MALFHGNAPHAKLVNSLGIHSSNLVMGLAFTHIPPDRSRASSFASTQLRTQGSLYVEMMHECKALFVCTQLLESLSRPSSQDNNERSSQALVKISISSLHRVNFEPAASTFIKLCASRWLLPPLN